MRTSDVENLRVHIHYGNSKRNEDFCEKLTFLLTTNFSCIECPATLNRKTLIGSGLIW